MSGNVCELRLLTEDAELWAPLFELVCDVEGLVPVDLDSEVDDDLSILYGSAVAILGYPPAEVDLDVAELSLSDVCWF